MAVELASSRTYPIAVERAFDVVLPTPLPQLFSRRYAAIPAVREVRDQQGPWGTVGQTRTVRLADGGSIRETLTVVDRPRAFRYRLSEISGPMKPLVTGVEGRWLFEPAGDGTRVLWGWTVEPRGALGRAAMPLFARMWRGYARQALEELERVLVP
ncbi:SRPBCC family protein [Nocardioides sp.]|uniref:SRPBCC family protein n=1 Tax=Nocardioides sp. TaxID=35761 RepID=UPI003784A042